jgi:TolB-like protein
VGERRSIIAELRRRHVFRVAGLYIVAAWVVLQVADLAFENFGLLAEAMRFVWYALIAGFPLALVWGWRYDLTTRGIVRTPPASDAGSSDMRLRGPDYAILSALAAITLFILGGMINEIRSLPGASSPYAINRNVRSSIAVLPLDNLSGDPNKAYLAAGMHDALITSLAKITSFRVISRTSTVNMTRNLTVPEIGETLGVDKIIEGSVTSEGDNVRIIVQLIDTKTDEHIWTENYVRSFESLVDLQNEMATSIASAVKIQLTPDELRRLESEGDVNPETYDAYLRAMYRIRRETGDGMREGMDILRDAVENDPTSALAWAGLAYGYGELGHSPFPVKGAYPRAKAAADRAIELDPDLAEAHLAVAMYQIYYEWDFVAGEATLRRAIEMNPSLVNAYYHLAWLLELHGRDEEAIALGVITKTLDPLSPFFGAWLADQYRDAGMFDEAIAEVEDVMRMADDYPVAVMVLGQIYLDMGDHEKAIGLHEQLRDNYFWSFVLATSLATAGRDEEALAIAKKYEEDGDSMVLVLVHAALGNREETLQWLQRSYDERIPWYPWMLKWYPQTREMYDDPKFLELAAEIGL